MGVLKDCFQGVGFGVGTERLPSVFANLGASVIATDAPPEIGLSSGWTETGQHSDTLNELFIQISSAKRYSTARCRIDSVT
jgi:hypothetical protein